MTIKKVCVVGAGVIGLSSAVCIQSEISGVDVTIIADEFSPNTTGDGSAGFWNPYHINPDQTGDVLEWGKITFQYMLNLMRSEHAGEMGVALISGYSFDYKADLKPARKFTLKNPLRQMTTSRTETTYMTEQYESLSKLKTRSEISCSGRISISYSTCHTRHFVLCVTTRGTLQITSYSLYQDQLFGFRDLTVDECSAIHPNKRQGVTFTTIAIDVKSYLPWLMNKYHRNNGKVIEKYITTLDELKGDYDVIVNCTGLGSYKLLSDKNLQPIRGQTIRVHAPWIKHFYFSPDPGNPKNHVHIIPGARDVFLGGTQQKGNWSKDVDETDRENIYNGCCRLIPSIRKAKILHNWVGLRPSRSAIRVEMETNTPNKTMIVHNYGHGGCGVTLHWGCAQKTSKLVREALQLCQQSEL